MARTQNQTADRVCWGYKKLHHVYFVLGAKSSRPAHPQQIWHVRLVELHAMWTLFLVVFFLEAANSSVPVGENVTEVYIILSLGLMGKSKYSSRYISG